MELNWRFENALSRGLTSYGEEGTYRTPQYEESNKVFCTVPINKDIIEVPCFCRPSVERIIISNLKENTHYDEVGITLGYIPQGEKKTGEALIAKLLGFSNLTLYGVRDGKDNMYYGCSGLILNKDFTPILMSTLTLCRNCIGEESYYSYTDIHVKINSLVFGDSKGVVEKCILNKVIYAYRNLVGCQSPYSFNKEHYIKSKIKINQHPRIIIEDFQPFFTTPAEAGNLTDSDMNTLIRESAMFDTK